MERLRAAVNKYNKGRMLHNVAENERVCYSSWLLLETKEIDVWFIYSN